MTFEKWYLLADAACKRISGLGLDSLADGNSFDAFADEVSPEDYARDMLEGEGFPG